MQKFSLGIFLPHSGQFMNFTEYSSKFILKTLTLNSMVCTVHFLDLLLDKPNTFKILRVLLENLEQELTKYAIKKYSGIKHIDAALSVLISLNMVDKVEYNGITKYRANIDDAKVKAFKRFFSEIGYIK